MKKMLFLLFIIFYGYVYSQDARIKLNSVGGMTGFQIQDANGVVVSSVTSDGNIYAKHGINASTGVFTAIGNNTYSIITSSGIKMNSGTLDIPIGAIKNNTILTEDIDYRQVTNDRLLITSTWTIDTSQVTTNTNSWSDMPGMYGELYIATAPAVIFLYFNCTAGRSDSGYTKTATRFNINGNPVGYGEVYFPVDLANTGFGLGMNAIYRVTDPGPIVVKVQWRSGDDNNSYGTAIARNRLFSAFVLGAP